MATNLKDSKLNRDAKDASNLAFFSIDELSVILEMLRENGVTEFKLERGDEKLSLKRGVPADSGMMNAHPVQAAPQFAPQPQMEVFAPAPAARPETQLQVITGQKVQSNLHEVKSPMVGTFYRRPSADAEAFVSVGTMVKKGDKLCLVEAMKLFNEIVADMSGKIVEVCLDDGQMVEFGEALFRIDPNA